MPLLQLTDIEAIFAIGINRGFDAQRPTLLGGIDKLFVANLETSTIRAAQLRLDLYALNSAGRRVGENIPLQQWLANAEALVMAFPADLGALKGYAAGIVEQPEPDPAEARLVASATLASLKSLSAENADVRAAFAGARAAMRDIGARLTLLATQKRLHDLLHELQIEWLPQIQASVVRERFLDPAQQPMIAACLDRMDSVYTRAESELDWLEPDSPEYRRQSKWISELHDISAKAHAALTDRAFEPANTALGDLRRLIKLNMAQLNTLINYSLDDVDLEALAGHLRDFAAKSPNPDDPRTVQLRDAATRLLLLDDEIRKLVRVHDNWQRVDDEFWSAEDNFIFRAETAENLERFSQEWPGISSSVAEIAGDPPAQWYPMAAAVAANFLQKCPIPAQPPVPPDARDDFRRFVTMTRNQFRQVDVELKGRCNRLDALTRKLRDLGE